jgi:hypothetical protein
MPLSPIQPGRPPATSHDARVAERLAALERRVRTLEAYFSGGSTQQVPLVQSLPSPGRKGRLVMLAGDGKVYRDTGAAWTAVG